MVAITVVSSGGMIVVAVVLGDLMFGALALVADFISSFMLLFIPMVMLSFMLILIFMFLLIVSFILMFGAIVIFDLDVLVIAALE